MHGERHEPAPKRDQINQAGNGCKNGAAGPAVQRRRLPATFSAPSFSGGISRTARPRRLPYKQLCCICTVGGWALAGEVVSASIYRRAVRLHLPSVPTTYLQGQRVQVVEEHARQLAPQVAVQETHLLVAGSGGEAERSGQGGWYGWAGGLRLAGAVQAAPCTHGCFCIQHSRHSTPHSLASQ